MAGRVYLTLRKLKRRTGGDLNVQIARGGYFNFQFPKVSSRQLFAVLQRDVASVTPAKTLRDISSSKGGEHLTLSCFPAG